MLHIKVTGLLVSIVIVCLKQLTPSFLLGSGTDLSITLFVCIDEWVQFDSVCMLFPPQEKYPLWLLFYVDTSGLLTIIEMKRRNFGIRNAILEFQDECLRDHKKLQNYFSWVERPAYRTIGLHSAEVGVLVQYNQRAIG